MEESGHLQAPLLIGQEAGWVSAGIDTPVVKRKHLFLAPTRNRTSVVQQVA